jgi:multidrug transporter EmrE-like cation transporter
MRDLRGSAVIRLPRWRSIVGVTLCAIAAWLIAFFTWSTQPAAYDFVALYAAARLVATGQAASVTDPEALLAMEHATLPARTILLNDPNAPALALLMAPLGALPLTVAYAAWSALGVLAMLAAARRLGYLADAAQPARLLPFAMLAPSSLIALAHGQTTPFVLLAVAAALRAPPLLSGALLGFVALRPQLLPLFALVALMDRRRAIGLVASVAAIGLVSILTVGLDGMARYPTLLTLAATELRPGELGLAALVRRIVGGEDLALNALLGVVSFLIGAVAVLRGSRVATMRMVDAATWSILVAPHALFHDGVMAYPAVARAATSARATAIWVGSGLAAVLTQEAGIPVAAFWLLALWWWGGRGGTASVQPLAADRP